MSAAEVIPMPHARAPFVRNADTIRPYRLWHATDKRALRWRCYANKRHALIGALIATAEEVRVGATIEVFDIRYGTLIGQFTKRVKHVQMFIASRAADPAAQGRLPAEPK